MRYCFGMVKKVFIYGGCTSRDAVEYYPQHDLDLLQYVARQSLISAFRPAEISEFAIDLSERPFQRRMIQGDIAGSLPTNVRRVANEIDLFIWDLMIERVGVAKVRSGGMVTLNGTDRIEGVPPLGGSYIFGTEGHLRQWSWALEKFVSLIESLNIKDKVVINATPWAMKNAAGEKFQSSSKSSPEWFNNNVSIYWELAESAGIKVARVAQEKAIADPDHKWGPAYFHYVPETYKAQLEAITSIL